MRTAKRFTPADYGSDPWIIEVGGTDPEKAGIYETILALGNGHIGARGSFEQGDPRHQPGVFVNGFHETWSIDYPESAYGYAKTGQTILYAPDTTGVTVVADDRPLVLAEAEVTRRLDLRQGLVTTIAVWPDVTVRWLRLVSLSRRHLLAVRVEIERKGTGPPAQGEERKGTGPPAQGEERKGTGSPAQGVERKGTGPPAQGEERKGTGPPAQGEERKGTGSPAQGEERKGTGPFQIESGWRNRQDTDYLSVVDEDSDPRRARSFERRTLVAGPVEVNGASMATTFRTVRSGMELALAVDHRPSPPAVAVERASIDELEFTLEGSPIEKTAAYVLTTNPAEAAAELRQAPDFAGLAREQVAALYEFWSHASVEVGGDPVLQQAVNWALYQLHQASAQVVGKGIPAKGLTGQAYEGHYFWDTDVFVLPFLAHHSAQAAAELIRFRHALLPAARLRARELSHVGALYPWRTINGEEASAYYEAGTAQFHIDAAVVYGIDAYLKATGDEDLLWECGVEIAAETARFWSDLGFFEKSNPAAPSFHIHMCTGPDEYSALVDDNAYTNYMARFNLATAARWAKRMSAEHPARYQSLADRIGLDSSEVETWERAAAAMELPIDPNLGITPQDARFLEREAWDWDTPDDQYPLLLNFHPLVIYRHQVLKQADVVMAMFLLPDAFSDDLTLANFNYYDPITTSDSSLSPAVQSAVAARIGRSDLAITYFRHAAFLDLANLAGNTSDGVHMATAGGVWHALVAGFGGFTWRSDRPHIAPNLPPEWDRLGFALSIRGSRLRVEVLRDRVTVHLEAGEPVDLDIWGTVHTITRQPTIVVR